MNVLYKFMLFYVFLCFSSFDLYAINDDEKNVLGIGKSTIKWIEDIPIQPDQLVGRVYYISNNKFESFPISVFLPVEEIDDVVVTKSIVKKSTKSGEISFGGIFELKGEKDKAFEFQVIQGKKWTSIPKSREYESALWEFIVKCRNINSDKLTNMLMVQAVVKKKIWYRKYTKNRFSANSTYWMNIGGESFSSSSEYEEINKYGLLLVSIKDDSLDLTKPQNLGSLTTRIELNGISESTLSMLPSKVAMFDEKQSLQYIKAVELNNITKNLDHIDAKYLLNEFKTLNLER